MNFDKKNIFLLDGVGAIASAIFTGVLLPLFSNALGLPTPILNGLACFPLVYGLFSLGCYWLTQETKNWMLLGIITGNIIYCFVSFSLVFLYVDITRWGQSVLIAEVLVILGVVAIELKVYRKAFSLSAPNIS